MVNVLIFQSLSKIRRFWGRPVCPQSQKTHSAVRPQNMVTSFRIEKVYQNAIHIKPPFLRILIGREIHIG